MRKQADFIYRRRKSVKISQDRRKRKCLKLVLTM